jgi:DNA polymerase III subunit chi
MDISFYQLLKTPLDKALPRLLDKAYEAGFRCLVVCDSPERRDALNGSLWTFTPSAFLPHGCDGDPMRHPIWLSLDSKNSNQSTLIAVTNGIVPDNLREFTRCLDLFDGHDPIATQQARERYKSYAKDGHNLTFWQQTDQGTWSKAA